MAAEVPSTMWAWRKHQGSTEPEVPVPTTPPRGYLVRVIAAGVCHTDHVLVNAPKLPPYYSQVFTLGHESCGTIVAVGSEVKDSTYTLGDNVAVFSVAGCGEESCRACVGGSPQLCTTGDRYGIGTDGSFTEYLAVNPRAIVLLPEGVSPAVGAVATDAVTTAHHACFQRGGVKKGDVVLLFGLGGLGFNALQMLLSRGIRVVVSDVKEELLQSAAQVGVRIEDVVPVEQKPRDYLKDKGLEGQIDVVLDFVGIPQTSADAQWLIRPGGTIVAIGGMAPEVSINMQLCLQKRISLLFSYGGLREDLVDALAMISRREIEPQVRLERLEEFPRVLADLHAGKITGRVALLPKDVNEEMATAVHRAEKL